MKVTLNWLKQYVDFNWSPEDLTGWSVLQGPAPEFGLFQAFIRVD